MENREEGQAPVPADVGRHTPGPWRMTFEPPTPDYEYPYMRLSAGADDDFFEITGIIQEANARLIAAAPDLLEALRGIIRADNDYDGIGTTEMKAARAAIRKATGEA
jgi:hypothetical protein